jgi:hypothetical protein
MKPKNFLIVLLSTLVIALTIDRFQLISEIRDYRRLAYDAIELAKSWRQRYIDCNDGIIVSDRFVIKKSK